VSTKKYELSENSKTNALGRKVFQIRALQDIARFGIKKGDFGGWVQSELNLSQDGNAWVYGNAQVYGNAWVYGNAQVYGDARVFGDARVYGNAWVYGNARVFGDAQVEKFENLFLASPIANGYFITLHRTEKGHQINIGCWSGTIDELLPKVRERRLTEQEVAEYEALVPLLQKRIDSWKPVESEKELEIEALEMRLAELRESE